MLGRVGKARRVGGRFITSSNSRSSRLSPTSHTSTALRGAKRCPSSAAKSLAMSHGPSRVSLLANPLPDGASSAAASLLHRP